MYKMKSTDYIISMLIFCLCYSVFAQEAAPQPENFYNKSLHYTNKGIEFIYSKEQGGLERLTGLSVVQMNCLKSKCHVTTCDECHKKEIDGKAYYSVAQAKTEQACQRCHPVEKDDPDIHFSKGMKCMDCHSRREIHGDGIEHKTYMEPGFFDVRCENCHDSLSPSLSHKVHKGKLDCTPCHVRDMITCVNCHIETRLNTSKDTSVPLNNMFFLVNHDGRVKLANFLSYVYGNKTMITLAPAFPHSIKKEGRKCTECHNSRIVKDIKNNTFQPFWWEKDTVMNVQGLIPVLEDMKWNIVYLTRKDGKWMPLEKPEKPLINFSGYCTPLNQTQFDKLVSVGGGK
jgi:hypothetical protein